MTTIGLRVSAWLIGVAVAMSSLPNTAYAWGDEGHRVVALVALKFLDAGAKTKVDALLATDRDMLTASDFVNRATWADRYRDSTAARRAATRQWHFVDIEVQSPDIDDGCFGHPPIPAGRVASAGPADDCIVDKITEFAAELKGSGTSQAERLLAFKFLLHFVGDVHQPLHSADEHDAGGNNKRVLPGGSGNSVNLHSYWDTTVIAGIERDEHKTRNVFASDLARDFAGRKNSWMSGGPGGWAMESFEKARSDAYDLPRQRVRDSNGNLAFPLSADYEQSARHAVKEQLAKAGMRLAFVLNESLR